MKIIGKYEPVSIYQKSFYGKCHVDVYDDGSEILYSYGTPIIKKIQTIL